VGSDLALRISTKLGRHEVERMRAFRIALVASLALWGCGSSAIGGQGDGGDAGPQPVATCNGGTAQCGCANDSECTFSTYPRIATSETCFCPSPCAYNPVRGDAAATRQSAFDASCGAGSGELGIPDGGCPAVAHCDDSNRLADGGCPSGMIECQPLQPRCFGGVCTGF